MRSTRHPRQLALIPLTLLAIGCATTTLPSIEAAGPSFEPEPDERRLWVQSRHEERTLRRQVALYEDREFAERTEAILHRLVPHASATPHGPEFAVYLVLSDQVNVFSYPHGSIYLYTGLLSLIEGENELATILAHEVQHIEGRHALRRHRQARNHRRRWTVAGIGSLATLIALDIDAIHNRHWVRHEILSTLTQILVVTGLDGFRLAAEASIVGYGDELESAADAGAMRRLRAAGYDVEAGIQVFDRLINHAADTPDDANYFVYSDREALDRRRERARDHVAGSAAIH